MIRHPRRHSPRHLEFIRNLPSLVRGEGPVEAAHIRFADLHAGKRYTGMAEKPDDCWAVPLAASAHRSQHAENERGWWARHGINPIIIAALLWLHSGDAEAAELVIANARSLAS